jgi:hypothetical protein
MADGGARAWSAGDEDVTLDSGREAAEECIIDMLADQIYTTRSPGDVRWLSSETCLELLREIVPFCGMAEGSAKVLV